MADPAPPPDDPPPDLTGRTLGDFRVLRKLGQGGMGQVYLARQLSLKRDVALKILSRELADSPAALKRFQAEAEAVARMTHANIVQVYAVGEQDGLRYMALEYVEGRDLRDHLDRKGPPELPLSLAVMRQVAAALLRASESGIVHRDIKPENILITRKAEVKVADFGLSRDFAAEGRPLNLTQTGTTLGTPLYMSPEQVRGEPVDHRTDLYSFGVTCYHLLAGHPPFRGLTPFEVAIQHVQADPQPLAEVRPDLPADLCAVVHKLMAKIPADRYQTARDALRDLAKVQKGLPVGLPPVVLSSPGVPAAAMPSAAPASPRWAVRVAGLALVAVAAAAGWVRA
jgi:serine/threonine-protein kinase